MIYAFTLKDEGSLGFRMVEPKSTANPSETQDRWRELYHLNNPGEFLPQRHGEHRVFYFFSVFSVSLW